MTKAWPWAALCACFRKDRAHPRAGLCEHNLKNLRCAETEKYAHVTYFFNGGIEKPFRRRRAHPRAVAESAHVRSEAGDERQQASLTHREGRREGDFDAIVMNFDNADMVGHSGKLEAAIKAVENCGECRGASASSTATRRGVDVTADPATPKDDRSRDRRAAHLSHRQSFANHCDRGRHRPLAAGGSLAISRRRFSAFSAFPCQRRCPAAICG